MYRIQKQPLRRTLTLRFTKNDFIKLQEANGGSIENISVFAREKLLEVIQDDCEKM